MENDRKRRLGFVDYLLLATLMPAFLIVLSVQVRDGLENGIWVYQFNLDGAASADDYPTLAAMDDPESRASAPALEPGDRLLRVGEYDLRGVTSRGAIARANRAAAGGPSAPVLAERDGRGFETRIVRLPDPTWWSGIPFSLAAMAVATLVLFRAPAWSQRRVFFVASGAFALTATSSLGRLMPEEQIGTAVFVAAAPVGYALIVWYLLHFTSSGSPPPRTLRALPVAASTIFLFGTVAYRWLPPLLPGVSNFALEQLGGAVGLIAIAAALTHSYLRSDALERRQLKWVLLGVYLASVPVVTLVYLPNILGQPRLVPIEWILLIATAIPIGFAVAILGYGLFDIDRVISATASVTILSVVVLAAALAGVPRLAAWLHGAIGLDSDVGQWALSLAVVGLMLPVHQTLRPWLDRRLFAEKHERITSLESLLGELSTCGTAEELTRIAVGRLEALFRPESMASYARQGELFTPIFVRGQAAPAAFEADSMLVRALEARTTPLATADSTLDPFDRAALTTLGAELVIPIRRTSELLAAFTCLGRKGSGDIYTAGERAVLAAVAHKIGDRLAQLDAEDLARDTLAMQERLRRYVPGAVADELAAGRELEPEAREVSVLFVDLRGYTQFAEGRAVEDVFSTINEHTERVSRVVKHHGGTVVEFNGDGMMAVFGAPEALPYKERSAVQAAREILEGMPEMLQVGVGVATGEAMVGSIRSADRWIWSAIGNTTNLAARLQTLTRDLDVAIAIDEATHGAAGYVCGDFEPHPGVAIRGRRGRWTVFALPAARV